MRFSLATLAVAALGAQAVVGSSWFTKAAYNKWHETELERWLSDHNVPFPTAADRKDLVDLVQTHWNDKVATPYNSWDTNQLSSYLSSQGDKVQKGAKENKDSLLSKVQSYWHETAEQASDSYSSVQDWIFDSWTESELKSFLDYHGIPNPSPRTRDSLLSLARSNYQSAANKIGETAAYPGDWLYQSWSDSDLKAWLDTNGIPAPQPSSRDKLVASVRRNARIASNKASTAASSVSSAAAGAQSALSDTLLNSWSDSQIKEWADKNGIKVPQGSKRNELLALARKHRAKLTGDNVSASASSVSASGASAFGAATSSAGNQIAQATSNLYSQGKYWYDYALNQFGLASEEAKKSLSSLSATASASLSSASSVFPSSASSASSVASASLSSASSLASKSASSAASVASLSASSAASVASKSASSGSGVLGKSASSAASVASKSASSLSSVAAASASSASKQASKSAPSAGKAATDYVKEGASSVKHAASEAAQRATDKVKEEL